jgi:hypothetical protein
MFVRNNVKKDHVHVLYPLLYVAKKEKNIKLCCLWGQKEKNYKVMFKWTY